MFHVEHFLPEAPYGAQLHQHEKAPQLLLENSEGLSKTPMFHVEHFLALQMFHVEHFPPKARELRQQRQKAWQFSPPRRRSNESVRSISDAFRRLDVPRGTFSQWRLKGRALLCRKLLSSLLANSRWLSKTRCSTWNILSVADVPRGTFSTQKPGVLRKQRARTSPFGEIADGSRRPRCSTWNI